MLVKELIEKLKGFSQDKDVILSSDEEGNSYHNVGEFLDNENSITIYPEHDCLD